MRLGSVFFFKIRRQCFQGLDPGKSTFKDLDPDPGLGKEKLSVSDKLEIIISTLDIQRN